MKAICAFGLFVLSPSLLVGQKPVECSAMGQSRIENFDGAFVEVDIPQAAKKTSAYFMVRTLPTFAPWKKCDEATNCEGRNWPDLKHPGTDTDGSLHYAAIVPAINAGVFTAMEDVRLVVTYSIAGPDCVSQVTSHKKAESNEIRWIFTPPGSPLSTFKTWFRTGSQWKLCDDFAGPRNLCVPDGITFDSADQIDAGDRAEGLWFNCRNNLSKNKKKVAKVAGFCRVQLMYKPKSY